LLESLQSFDKVKGLRIAEQVLKQELASPVFPGLGLCHDPIHHRLEVGQGYGLE
jgi:hypothetical protein